MLRRVFKEPTSWGLMGATFLAIFEVINSAGYSDNIALLSGLVEEVPAGREKIVFPGRVSTDFWGVLEIGTLDYIILAFLSYNIIGLWAHRPRDNMLSLKKSKKIIAIKSPGWIRVGILGLIVGLISTANKRGVFADLASSFSSEEKQGSFGRVEGGSWDFEPFEWGLLDYMELAILYSFFLYSIWKGIEVDKAKLNPIPDNRNYIEKIWGGIKEAEREQRSEIELAAPKANDSFTKLVKMLGAAVSLNVAASSLDEGNVKVAFNKWKNLTHSKGKMNKDWKGLSESLNQAGVFPEEEEE